MEIALLRMSTILGWLLAAPGPLPGRSWGSPGLLLAPPGPLLGSQESLRGWFWKLFALLLKALSENHETLFLQTAGHFLSLCFLVLELQNRPQIDPKSIKDR